MTALILSAHPFVFVFCSLGTGHPSIARVHIPFIHTWGQFRVSSQPDEPVSGLWEETRIPEENLCTHEENKGARNLITIRQNKKPSRWWVQKGALLIPVEFRCVTVCANWCCTANWQKCLQAEASNKHAFITVTSARSAQMSNNPKPNQHVAAQRGFVMKFPRFGGERLNKRFPISVVTDVMKGPTGSKHFRNKVQVPPLSFFLFSFFLLFHPNYRCCTI